jgi:CubicO group peptidase (beta-lactamase class C family)
MPFQAFSMKSRLYLLAAASGLTVALASSGAAQPQLPLPQTLPYSIFERYLEALRQEGGIPGLSAAIIRNGQIGWVGGFGREDIGRAIPASPDTPYPIAGITQAISSLLIGICVDRNLLKVDDPIRDWAVAFPEPAATVRNVLAHGSDGAPTGRYRYDPALYSMLTHVIDDCGDKPYRRFLADEIIERFGLARSVPGIDITDASNIAARQLFEPGRLSRFEDIVRRIAVPYRVDRFGNATASQYPSRSIDAATGMVSSVYDLARLDAYLDGGVPVSLKTLNDLSTTANFGAGPLPTGLGWFVQTSSNERLVWQFGLIPDAGSGIWLRIPGKRLTLILLANSAGLTSGLNLEQGDVTVSPFVKIFLRLFL